MSNHGGPSPVLRAVFAIGVLSIAGVVTGVDARSGPTGAAGNQAEATRFYVTVVDEAGAPVDGLGPPQFEVQVDGRSRRVLLAEPATEPLTLVVLAEGVGRDALHGARRLLHAVVAEAASRAPDTRIGLMLDEAAAAPRFETARPGRARLDAAIDRLYQTSATAPTEEALIAGARALQTDAGARALQTDAGARRALLVLSVRGQVRATLDPRYAADALRRARVLPWIYEVFDDRTGFAIVHGQVEPILAPVERLNGLVRILGGTYGRITGDQGLVSTGPVAARQLLSQYALTIAAVPHDAALRVGVRRAPGESPVRVIAPAWIGK